MAVWVVTFKQVQLLGNYHLYPPSDTGYVNSGVNMNELLLQKVVLTKSLVENCHSERSHFIPTNLLDTCVISDIHAQVKSDWEYLLVSQ